MQYGDSEATIWGANRGSPSTAQQLALILPAPERLINFAESWKLLGQAILMFVHALLKQFLLEAEIPEM